MVSVEQFIEVVPEKLGHASPALRLIGDGEDVLVVFVPGILGSRLTDPKFDRAVLWGKGGAPNLKDLVFRGQPASASLLERYPTGVTAIEVYGGIREKLERIVGEQIAFEPVAYDWRNDLRSAADQLDEGIRAVAAANPNRRLVIVAHSMGGLVTWAWMNRHWVPNAGSYPNVVELTRVWLIGSPVHGSCEMLRILMQGYQPDMERGRVERFGYRYLFGKMHAAAFTFPSVLQLLPSADRRRCLEVIGEDGQRTPYDHFELRTWTDHILPAVEESGKGWVWSTAAPWDALEMSKGRFLAELGQNLRKAKAFREELDITTNVLSSKVRFFYSYDVLTTRVVQLRGDEIVPLAMVDGDGRVRGDDARLSIHDEPSYQVRGDHDGILSSAEFLRFVDEKVAVAANDQKAGRLAEELVKSQDLLVAYGSHVGGVVPIHDMDFPAADPRSGEMRRAIAKVNVAVYTAESARRHAKIGAIIDDPRIAAIEAYGKLERGSSGLSPSEEAALYASVDVLWLPTEVHDRIELKIRYADSLRRADRPKAADAAYMDAFRLASSVVPSEPAGPLQAQLVRISSGIRSLERRAEREDIEDEAAPL